MTHKFQTGSASYASSSSSECAFKFCSSFHAGEITHDNHSVASPRPLGSGIMAGRHEKNCFLMKLLHFPGIRHDGIPMGLWFPCGNPINHVLADIIVLGKPSVFHIYVSAPQRNHHIIDYQLSIVNDHCNNNGIVKWSSWSKPHVSLLGSSHSNSDNHKPYFPIVMDRKHYHYHMLGHQLMCTYMHQHISNVHISSHHTYMFIYVYMYI